MLVSDLAKWPQLEVVSREALGPVLREQWLQQQGFSSTDHSVGLGRLKGVRYLLQGVISAPQDLLTITVQVIDVETGVVKGSITAHGEESEIPNLEQDLVIQILRVFDQSLDRNISSNSGEVEAGQPGVVQEPFTVEKGGKHALPSGHVPSYTLSEIDAFLTLEKLTHERKEAFQLAETIWREGWVYEMGQPSYQIWQLHHPTFRAVSTIHIPVSVFFSPRRMVEIFEKTGKAAADSERRLNSDGFLISMGGDSGAQQLFVEHFQGPRRVFVRALNEDGEVLAMFSHWTWRTERRFHMPLSRQISVPMWPKSFISGLALFPVAWIQGEGHQVTFDATILPVPDEHVLVRLEPLKESDNDEDRDPDLMLQEILLLESIEQLIRSHWTPAVTEALPSPGYLPGNKRTAAGVVHIQDGAIAQVQFQNWPDDPFFIKSLQDLQMNLLESCIACKNAQRLLPSSPGYSKTFRLQLTLIKDTHALQLGSLSP